MTDLQRALAEIEAMIVEERKATERFNRMYDRRNFAIHQTRMNALRDARSRLSALAATTNGDSKLRCVECNGSGIAYRDQPRVPGVGPISMPHPCPKCSRQDQP